MKLRELAERLGAELLGEGEVEIVGLNTIEAAGPRELTFLTNPKYGKFLTVTKAAAVLVDSAEKAAPCSLLVHDNPHYAFAQALTFFFPQPGSRLQPGIAVTAGVDPTATVDPTAHLGEDVVIGSGSKVGANCKVMAGVSIGADCELGSGVLLHPRVTILDGTQIGDRVTIHSGTVVGSDGFGYATKEGVHHKVLQVGRVRIEDDVEIGANCTIDRGALGDTIIGAGTKVDNLVQIAHNVRIGKGCIVVAQVGISGSTTLGDYVTLAGQVGLVGHIEIGDGAIVGAQAGVGHSLAGGMIYAGSPARELREFKQIEAYLHRLPRKMKELKELQTEVEELRQRLEELEKR
ncbi:MAG: UDP-3-O-(3-hydroxymyristoyl)glucosamine N-acyltransferase [bacterium]